MVEYGVATPRSQWSLGGFAKAGIIGGVTGALGGVAGKFLAKGVSAVAGKVFGRLGLVAEGAEGGEAAAAAQGAERGVPVFRSGAGDAAGGAAEGPSLTLAEARAAAEARGVDTSRMELSYQPKSDPRWLPNTFGFTRFTINFKPYVNARGMNEVTLTDLGLRSERDAVYTLAHELGHIDLETTDHELAELYAEELLKGQSW